MTLHVDHAALDSIAESLTKAGSELDGVSTSAPAAIDAGDGTPAIVGILAKMTENAGQLVVALAAAGEAVKTQNTTYRLQDLETADQLTVGTWTE